MPDGPLAEAKAVEAPDGGEMSRSGRACGSARPGWAKTHGVEQAGVLRAGAPPAACDPQRPSAWSSVGTPRGVLVEVVPGPAPCAAATENAVGLAANNRDGLRRPFRFGGLESEVNAEASEPVMK